jgi:hypothetical protein
MKLFSKSLDEVWLTCAGLGYGAIAAAVVGLAVSSGDPNDELQVPSTIDTPHQAHAEEPLGEGVVSNLACPPSGVEP